jgi:hypothetical protein
MSIASNGSEIREWNTSTTTWDNKLTLDGLTAPRWLEVITRGETQNVVFSDQVSGGLAWLYVMDTEYKRRRKWKDFSLDDNYRANSVCWNPITNELLVEFFETSSFVRRIYREADGTGKLIFQQTLSGAITLGLLTDFGKYFCFAGPQRAFFSSRITPFQKDYDTTKSGKVREVAIECEGRGSGGSVIEEPTDIIDDILQNILGVASGDIDSTSKGTVQDILDNTGAGTFKVHRYINEPISGINLIQELCRDCGILISVRMVSGVPKYYFDYWKPEASAPTDVADDIVIKRGSFNAEKHGTLYINRIVGRWQHAPHTGDYQRVYEKDDTTAQTDDKTTVEKTLESLWRYDTSDYVHFETDYLLDLVTFLATKPELIELEIFNEFAEDLGNIVKVNYGHFSNVLFQVRSIKKDFTFLTDRIVGVDTTNLSAPP